MSALHSHKGPRLVLINGLDQAQPRTPRLDETLDFLACEWAYHVVGTPALI